MILLLHNNEKSTQSFINYLNKVNCKFIDITIEDVIKEVEINEEITPFTKKGVWKFKEHHIGFNNLMGLYNRLNFLNTKFFDDFIKQDRFYVQNEWWAYLIHRINSFDNCVNYMTKEMSSGIIYQFPFVFRKAMESGFSTPLHYISTDVANFNSAIKDITKFTTRNHIYGNNNFSISNEITINDIAIIEYIDGPPVIAHLVGQNIYCTAYIKNEAVIYELDDVMRVKCMNLMNILKLFTLEIFFKLKNGEELILHNFSPFPNWLLSHKNYLPLIYQNLYSKLSNDCNTFR